VRRAGLAADPLPVGARAELALVEGEAMNVAEWIKRAGPIQRKEAVKLCAEATELREKFEDLEGRAAPALKPAVKAAAGHLRWAEKTLRDWLLRNPD
jgi:hypothetical protein